MQVSLTPDMQKFIEEQMQSGAYGSPEQVVHSALLALRAQDAATADDLADLRRMARAQGEATDRIRLFGEVGGLTDTGTRDIPDPWGGGPDEFGHVLDLLGAAAPVIATRLARRLETAG